MESVILALENADGSVLGGLTGKTAYDWLFIQLLFVPDEMRRQGVGRALIEQAERIAKEPGCIGAWLDTFNFQSGAFYENLGYSLFGEISDHPTGGARYFPRKYFV
jgi:GNAT superfamily N-acetyltransferase